jgi:hypothetical protein
MNPHCPFQGAGYSALTGGGLPIFGSDFWNHNTIQAPDNFSSLFPSISPMYSNSQPAVPCPPYSPPPNNLFIYQNNMAVGGFVGVCFSDATIINDDYTNSTFASNALMGAVGSNYTGIGGTNSWSGGAFPANNAAIGFTVGTGIIPTNYKLSSASNYSAANASATQLATDGTDLGADIDVISLATSGAAAGTPSWNVLYGIQVTVGSDRILLTYSRPSGQTCSAMVYSGLARNVTANLVSTIADSIGVLDGNTVQLVIYGLTPGAIYPWVTISCTGGVMMMLSNVRMKTPGGSVSGSFSASSSRTWTQFSDAAMTIPITSVTGTSATFSVAHWSTNYVAVTVGGVPVSPPTVVIAP